jgi:hypothetical protein
MANITIPQLPAAISLTGTEQIGAVQSGASVRVTAAQIAALAPITAGGSTTQVQYNNNGVLGGSTMTYSSASGSFTISASASAQALVLNGLSAGTAALRVNTCATTGAQTATFTATNKPGSGTTAPTKWLPVVLDGTTYYIPCWT